MSFHRSPALVAATLLVWGHALAGCAGQVAGSVPGAITTSGTLAAAALPDRGATVTAPVSVSSITGKLTVPTTLLASYKVISNNGGSILVSGSGNLATTVAGATKLAALHLLELDQSAYAGASIYLADAGGNPIPNLAAVQTAADGTYTISNVPVGYTFVVAADLATTDGKTAHYQTMTRSSALGATANLDASTTLVSTAVVNGVAGSDLGDFNPATFSAARDAADSSLTTAQLPDFTSRADILAKITALSAQVAALQTSIDEMKQDLKDIKQSLTTIQQEIAALPKGTPAPATQPQSQPSGRPAPPSGGQPPPNGAQGGLGLGCGSAPAQHYFHVTFNGQLAANLAVSISDPHNGATLGNYTADSNGNIIAELPGGCGLEYKLTDGTGKVWTLNYSVPTATQDTAAAPEFLNFGASGS